MTSYRELPTLNAMLDDWPLWRSLIACVICGRPHRERSERGWCADCEEEFRRVQEALAERRHRVTHL